MTNIFDQGINKGYPSGVDDMVTLDKNHSCFYDDVKSFKEIVFHSDVDEDISDGKRLTSLVRESYLRRLREMLNKNYQLWFEKHKEISSFQTESDKQKKFLITSEEIENCVKFLEQKALRSCMIASLYQKSMVNLINAIKHKTNENQLCDDLSNVNDLYPSTSSVSTQTDNVVLIDEKCQTDESEGTTVSSKCMKNGRSTTSLLDLPLPDPKDVLLSLSSDFIDRQNPKMNLVKPTFHSKETVAKVQPQPRRPLESKICNSGITDFNGVKIIDSLPDSEGFSRESKRRKLNNDLYSGNLIKIVPEDDKRIIDDAELMNILMDDDDSNNCFSNYNNNTNTNQNKNNGNLIDDYMANLESCIYNDNISSTENTRLLTQGDNESDHLSNNTTSLDDRLAELGAFANDESNISSTNSKTSMSASSLKIGHRRSWYMESTAHYCNLAKVLMSLDNETRKRVKDKFKELFGEDDEDDHITLTPELVSVCRKRTANMVVAELTPYFAAKKFGSRFLFKEFAKRVTNSILSRTYVSDSSAIKQFVSEYFNEHSFVNSIEDIEF